MKDTGIKMHVRVMAGRFILMGITISENGLKINKMEKVPM